MESNDIEFIKLEVHETRDIKDKHVNGSLTVVWRDWDEILKFHPKMVYVTSVNPGEKKGPHLHTIRHSYFVCIRGKVLFIAKNREGKYLEIESSEENPTLISIPKGLSSAHINITDKVATVLTLANPAWRPNNDEMKNVTYDDYDWDKWNRQNYQK